MPTPNGQEVNKIICRLSRPNWTATAKILGVGSLPIPATVGGGNVRQRFYNATSPPPAFPPIWTVDPTTEETGDTNGRWLRKAQLVPSGFTLDNQKITGARSVSIFYALGQANDRPLAPDTASVESGRLGAAVSLSAVPYANTPSAADPVVGDDLAVPSADYFRAFRVRAVVARLVTTAAFAQTNMVGALYVQRQHSIEV